MNFKPMFATALVTISVLAIPTAALAQDASPTTLKDKIVENRCQRVTTRVDNVNNRLTGSENIRQNRHQKVIDRLNTIIAKVEAAGLDVSKLKSDLTELTAKRDTWQAEYTELLEKLAATKQFACGNSEGQFVAAVKAARDQRKVMHQANLDFWSYVRNTVKPDIKAIRSQLKSNNSSTQ